MAVHDQLRKPQIISISWGGPESSWTQQLLQSFTDVAQEAALLGITVMCIEAYIVTKYSKAIKGEVIDDATQGYIQRINAFNIAVFGLISLISLIMIAVNAAERKKINKLSGKVKGDVQHTGYV